MAAERWHSEAPRRRAYGWTCRPSAERRDRRTASEGDQGVLDRKGRRCGSHRTRLARRRTAFLHGEDGGLPRRQPTSHLLDAEPLTGPPAPGTETAVNSPRPKPAAACREGWRSGP